MKCQRFIFTIICTSISSAAIECNALSLVPRDLTLLTSAHQHHEQSESVAHRNTSVEVFRNSPQRLAQQPNLNQNQDSAASVNSSALFDRRWIFIAMTVTSSIATLLLWVLFRTPKKPHAHDSSATAPEQAISITNKPSSTKHSQQRWKEFPQEFTLASDQLTDPITDIEIDIVEELIKDLQDNPSEALEPSYQETSRKDLIRKSQAIWEIARIGDSRCIEPLVLKLAAANSADRSLIFDAITQIIERSFEPVHQQLFVSLQDENPEIRKHAIQELASLYEFVAPITKKLGIMQSDADYEVRQTAIRALAKLNLNLFTTNLEDYSNKRVNHLAPDDKGNANLHLVAYLLAELDNEKQ